jgi:hypothetical protein
MDRYELDGNIIRAYDLAALDRAEQEVEPTAVTCVRIGARLYNALPSVSLFQRLKGFPNLRTVVLSDDWIRDDEMPAVQRSFEAEFPGIIFSWSQELLAAGKHGR